MLLAPGLWPVYSSQSIDAQFAETNFFFYPPNAGGQWWGLGRAESEHYVQALMWQYYCTDWIFGCHCPSGFPFTCGTFPSWTFLGITSALAYVDEPEPPLPPCNAGGVDAVAISEMLSWTTPLAFERGATIICDGGAVADWRRDSFREIFTDHLYVHTNDPCKVNFANPAGRLGAMHSHPYFQDNDEYLRGNGCHGDTNPLSPEGLEFLNFVNHYFAIGTTEEPGDELWWNTTSTPLYLLVPDGGIIKKQDHTGGPWIVYP